MVSNEYAASQIRRIRLPTASTRAGGRSSGLPRVVLAFRRLEHMAGEVLSIPDPYRRTNAERRIERCPNCGGATKIRRNDQRVIWPRITSNLAPPFSRYAMEEVWTCVVCDESMIEIHVFEESDRQDRDPADVRLVYPDSYSACLLRSSHVVPAVIGKAT